MAGEAGKLGGYEVGVCCCEEKEGSGCDVRGDCDLMYLLSVAVARPCKSNGGRK